MVQDYNRGIMALTLMLSVVASITVISTFIS
jgi:hypothetical protein